MYKFKPLHVSGLDLCANYTGVQCLNICNTSVQMSPAQSHRDGKYTAHHASIQARPPRRCRLRPIMITPAAKSNLSENDWESFARRSRYTTHYLLWMHAAHSKVTSRCLPLASCKRKARQSTNTKQAEYLDILNSTNIEGQARLAELLERLSTCGTKLVYVAMVMPFVSFQVN